MKGFNRLWAPLLCLGLVCQYASTENILVFVGVTTFSHRIAMWPLVERLVELGHNVTFFSAHPPRALANPKVHEFVSKGLQKSIRKFVDMNLLELRRNSGPRTMHATWFDIFSLNLEALEFMLEDQEFIEWYESSSSFDLVLIDALGSDYALALAHKFKAKHAIVSTTAPYSMWQHDIFGAAPESSWLPDMQWIFPEDMNLFQRILNTGNSILWEFYRRWYFYPGVEKIFRERLGLKDLPPLVELEKNLSLVLANTHFSDDYARSYPPLVVPVSGMHCYNKKLEPTPKDMKTFMDSSSRTGGFMYVSFGSAAMLSQLPPELLEMFFNAMSKAKTNFLVKWNGDVPPDMPKNAFTASWIPQQAVLAHPNNKGFLTHGGLLGIQEAIFHGVPLIVFPIFGEQDYNGQKIENRGRGIKLELATLTQDQLDSAISSLLTDPRYKENMEIASKLFRDRPQNPVDTAVWWTEFILRNGQVEALKPLGIHQTWYQKRLIDVWFTVFTVGILLPALMLFLLIRKLCKRVKSPKNNENAAKSGKKKN